MAPKSNTGKQVVKSAKPVKKATTKPVKKAVVKSDKPKKVVKVVKRKAYTRPQFRRPHTYRKPATVKPGNNTKAVKTEMDAFRVIRYPLTTEKAMKKIEVNNTLTFIVDPYANKTAIKKAIMSLYNVKSRKVNTMIRPDGLKKAYVLLASNHDSIDVANKINIL
eukprot:Tbor_TRINITY_DN5394_c0_g2::TRINITY_DN5394_c0_g2_i3::g.5216::m.5216/K02893/RP-L23Ae, RPL23A; large subunit ribosomal protein L23Ae